jgi:hypothetical protein
MQVSPWCYKRWFWCQSSWRYKRKQGVEDGYGANENFAKALEKLVELITIKASKVME